MVSIPAIGLHAVEVLEAEHWPHGVEALAIPVIGSHFRTSRTRRC